MNLLRLSRKLLTSTKVIEMQIVFDFPREVMELSPERGRGYRKIVRSNGDLERYWEGKNGVSNAYMTVRLQSNTSTLQQASKLGDPDCTALRYGL